MDREMASDFHIYTSDHIGRPFNLRDEDKTLTWHEHHYAFGEPIHEVVDIAMSAGSGDHEISWKPNFRFPGQYQDPDMGLSATSTSLFVQNHYREYMPGLGRYNRWDPLSEQSFVLHSAINVITNPWPTHIFRISHISSVCMPSSLPSYIYTNQPFRSSDFLGLATCDEGGCFGRCRNWMKACMDGMIEGDASMCDFSLKKCLRDCTGCEDIKQCPKDCGQGKCAAECARIPYRSFHQCEGDCTDINCPNCKCKRGT